MPNLLRVLHTDDIAAIDAEERSRRRGGKGAWKFPPEVVHKMRMEWLAILQQLAQFYRLPLEEVATWHGRDLAFALQEAGLPRQVDLARRWNTNPVYWHQLVFLSRSELRERARRNWRLRQAARQRRQQAQAEHPTPTPGAGEKEQNA